MTDWPDRSRAAVQMVQGRNDGWKRLGVEADPIEAFVWASLAVHCSPIRLRPAEVVRDRSAEELTAAQREEADGRIRRLCDELPHP